MRTLIFFFLALATVTTNADSLESLCNNLEYYRRPKNACKEQPAETIEDGSTVITFKGCEYGLDHITFTMRNVPSSATTLGAHQSCTQTEYRLDLDTSTIPHKAVKDSNGKYIYKTSTTIFRKFTEKTTTEYVSKDKDKMIIRIPSNNDLSFTCTYEGEKEACQTTKASNFSGFNQRSEIDTPIKSLQIEDWNKLRKGEPYEFRVEQPNLVVPVKHQLNK